MKRNLSILLLAVTTLFFTACQKKQMAYFQKSQQETYAHAPKAKAVVATEEVTTTVSNPLADEVAVASTDESVSSVVVETPKKAEAPVLKMDEKSIDAEFAKLDQLEDYVKTNNVTADDVKNTELAKELKLDTNVTATIAPAGDLPANIPAFWWGCVLSWVGVLVVYLVTDKDKDQTKKALYGCLVNAAVWIIYYFVVLGAIGAGI